MSASANPIPLAIAVNDGYSRKMEKSRPPTHPGQILEHEFLRPLQISSALLARYLMISPRDMDRIISGVQAIGVHLACKLAGALNTTPQFWMHLQIDHDVYRAMQSGSYDLGPIVDTELYRTARVLELERARAKEKIDELTAQMEQAAACLIPETETQVKETETRSVGGSQYATQIRSLFARGLSARQIADDIRISPAHVYNIANRLGLSFSARKRELRKSRNSADSRSQAKIIPAQKKSLVRSELQKALDSGLSERKIAREFGVSRGFVRQEIERMGLTRRTSDDTP